ncbi:MAG: response regulator, partial [Dokdonella sp.]|uniref:response regulator n=1 Tax=Dokdonella sp. TaxID=2291710 RepID=UPI003BAEA358
ELMEGTITVESTLGSGSCFTVSLPLEAAAVDPVERPVHPQNGSPGAGDNEKRSVEKFHVLVVEDDPTIAAVVCGMLEAGGHRVTHAAHGLAALAALSEPHIDLALVDLDLPGIDGLQLTRLVRNRERDSAAHLPIIAITARATGDEETQAQAAGMDGFLRKPIRAATLESAIARFLPGHAKPEGGTN